MANYINFSKAIFNPYNPKVLNEGQFSWMTQDTEQQIGSERQNTIDVWMYDNEGNSWYENKYDGYGEFGGMDYYELLAKMNGYSDEDLKKGQEMRNLGIDLAFKKLKTKDKGKKVLFPALVADGKYNWKRHDFTEEAESDPNQSWYQEPEYDDYEDEYYDESKKPELTWDSLKESLGLNEAKKLGIGDRGVDYNDNVVEIIAIGRYDKIAKMFKKEMRADAEDYGFEELAANTDYYLTKNIEAPEGNVGDFAIYPVRYDMANYWGLDEVDESKVNEGRSINKISKDHAATVLAMSNTAKEWKEAEGDRKSELLEKLRELNRQKAELEKELDDAVAGKDRNLQLSLEEAEELAYLEKDIKNIFENEDSI
tara:strand:+ start:1414 stop:2517 length:1104 start_codon:yes stop_codon:yes gene_type:complete